MCIYVFITQLSVISADKYINNLKTSILKNSEYISMYIYVQYLTFNSFRELKLCKNGITPPAVSVLSRSVVYVMVSKLII